MRRGMPYYFRIKGSFELCRWIFLDDKGENLRDVVIAHYKNEKKAPEISRMLVNDVHHITVHRWIQLIND